ncbi:MAG: MBOAT family protein [Dysgonamonadaceae bacterium]|jgi:D-alanyl-lipoteichoic acid acyltransferase DltB (MBOAT superfamily)|nr:MBOAT family protein [Dysgonamonadaceae bacterium]
MIADFFHRLFAFDSHSPLLFTQFYFWAFFAIVFAGFALLQNRMLLRNAFLFFISLFFYYKTSGLFVLILVFTTVFNFFQAKCIDRSGGQRRRQWRLGVGLTVNLFFLCYFKYAYFFTDVVNNLFGLHLHVFNAFAWTGNWLGGSPRFDVSNILLPVGISFYTFQNISYLMDVFRKRIRPVGEILNFGFYVSFFPQLVAGPIIRASEFVPQIYRRYHLGRKQFGVAVFWILNGLAKKIVLSDYIAVNFVDRVFANPSMFSGFENLVALFGYSLQVYADFSGYTDIAIGVAMLMGFYLPKNFHSPYKATNPGNFWKRWHISLSKWLQDYLYIPLGGNRNATGATYALIGVIALIALILSGSLWVGGAIGLLLVGTGWLLCKYPGKRKRIHTHLNLMNTMLIGGLWHGTSWNFMIWGGLNGLGILVYNYWKNWGVYRRTLVLTALAALCLLIRAVAPSPAVNIALVWVGILLTGASIRMLYKRVRWGNSFHYLGTCWAVFQTFVFISFTRLFFRSGSNLDPAESNQIAWDTARQMVARIGGAWDLAQAGAIAYEYRYVFALILTGLLIHWLPERFKRRYRLSFALLPLGWMAVAVAFAVFVIYQFITADLQTFIYFQF